LQNKAQQLEARLPLQSTMVQVPYENTLGGFAMFNTGITDLAPELYGWYGAPGINTNDTTSLFLIGNHFSVQGTRLVAGGVNVTDMEMLSRQVMRVTIPKNALMIERDTGKFARDPVKPAAQEITANVKDLRATFDYNKIQGKAVLDGDVKLTKPAPAAPPEQELFVDVHIATPYGVTSHLLIPALGKTGMQVGVTGPNPNAVVNWMPNAIAVGFVSKGLGIAASNPPTVRPSDLTIQLATAVSNVNNVDLILTIAGGGTTISAPFSLSGVALDKTGKTLTLTAAQRDSIIAAVFDKIGPFLNKDTAGGNAATVALKTITLKQDTAVVGTINPPDAPKLTVNFLTGS
jgi:hypothetical protein